MTFDECILCQRELKRTPTWQGLFERLPQVICQSCKESFEPVIEQGDVRSLFHYNEAMIDYLHRYKFMHDTILANLFRKEVNIALKNTIVVPIPMHPDKQKERTFSHVELLLQCAQIPYVELLRKESLEIQGTKTREERLATPQIFELRQKPCEKSYTVFDDIVTTGTTLAHAKKLLIEAGAKEVNCLTLIKA